MDNDRILVRLYDTTGSLISSNAFDISDFEVLIILYTDLNIVLYNASLSSQICF